MADRQPYIASLQPVVLEDNRRVMLAMVVEDLPAPAFGAIDLIMPDDLLAGPPQRPVRPDPNAPSPYPNIELSILDDRRREVASLFIVEHKEPYTSLTLHLAAPEPGRQYTARAEMTYQDQVLQVVETPFTLNSPN